MTYNLDLHKVAEFVTDTRTLIVVPALLLIAARKAWRQARVRFKWAMREVEEGPNPFYPRRNG
jgi:hypothetical protein